MEQSVIVSYKASKLISPGLVELLPGIGDTYIQAEQMLICRFNVELLLCSNKTLLKALCTIALQTAFRLASPVSLYLNPY